MCSIFLGISFFIGTGVRHLGCCFLVNELGFMSFRADFVDVRLFWEAIV